MGQVMVSIRMDEELKRNMERTCQELGMNMTTAFTVFAKKMSREHRIPFEVSADPLYSEENLSVLRDSLIQLQGGQAVSKPRRKKRAAEG